MKLPSLNTPRLHHFWLLALVVALYTTQPLASIFLLEVVARLPIKTMFQCRPVKKLLSLLALGAYQCKMPTLHQGLLAMVVTVM
jgi:hypothetical protein